MADAEHQAGTTGAPANALLRTAAQTYGSQLGVAVLSLGNALIVARSLGAVGRGEVAFLTAIAWLGSNISTFGVQEANVNLAAAEPHLRRSLATNSLILSVLLGAACAGAIAALVAIVPAAGGSASHLLLWLVLISLPMLILSTYLRFLIQGEYGFGVTNLAWLLPSVVNFSVNGALALAGVLSVGTAVATWIAGQLLGTAIMARYVMRYSAGFGRPDLALARRTLSFGGKSHVGRIMLLANYRLDQWILGAIAGPRELGLYSVAVAWAEALFLLPTALSAVQRPDIVRSSRREAVRLTARVFRVSLLATAAMAVGLIVLAPFLCVTIFGSEFRGSIFDLRVLALGAFGIVALKQLGSSLTGRRRPTAASLSIACAFVCTVALDFALIPSHGDAGAAIASSTAYTIGGVVIAIVFTRTLGGRAVDLVPRPSDARETWSRVRSALRRRRAEPASAVEEATKTTAA
ncbi:MAG: oligosaccharide flippase family protein [Solirubrobacteraceae bacterium]|nr:oligosaccharide flippase family protein [Solirubrobacteraceae bacterium]